MESSVDPPMLFVNSPSNDLDGARDSLSLPILTDHNVTLIQDEIMPSRQPTSSPRSLSVLAAEATISVMRSYRSEENVLEININPTEAFRPSEYSLADILLDRPCPRRQKSGAKKPQRSTSSPELLLYHHTSSLSTPALHQTRPRSQRPGVTSQSSFQIPHYSSTEQQSHLPSSRIIPPLEPNRRSRFLITYNYTQNRFRILRFSMETRPNPVGMQRFLRHPMMPRALLNQIQGLGAAAGQRQRGVLQRAAHTNDIPRAVRRQQQYSIARGGRQERDSNHRAQRSPIASTSRYFQSEHRNATPVDDLTDLVTYASLPTLGPNSQQASPVDSPSLVNLSASHPNSPSSSSTTSILNNTPPIFSPPINITSPPLVIISRPQSPTSL